MTFSKFNVNSLICFELRSVSHLIPLKGTEVTSKGFWLGLIMAVCLGGCCSEEGKLRAGARGATTSHLKASSGSSAPTLGYILKITSDSDLILKAQVTKAACNAGLPGPAEVEVDWESKNPSLNALRFSVSSNSEKPKTWIEGGAKGSETTGPWVAGGTVIEAHELSSDAVVGKIDVEASTCD